jgi:uncharacterized membrane protein
MEIAGLPLHPLVIHAAVAVTPLAALLAIVFAVSPKWRYLTRWPTAIATVLALGAVWVARLSGNALVDSRPELGQLVEDHQARGNILSWLIIAFTVAVAVAVWGLGGRSGFTSGIGERGTTVPVLDKVVPAVVVLLAVAVMVYLVLTGDAGARAVWG